MVTDFARVTRLVHFRAVEHRYVRGQQLRQRISANHLLQRRLRCSFRTLAARQQLGTELHHHLGVGLLSERCARSSELSAWATSFFMQRSHRAHVMRTRIGFGGGTTVDQQVWLILIRSESFCAARALRSPTSSPPAQHRSPDVTCFSPATPAL